METQPTLSNAENAVNIVNLESANDVPSHNSPPAPDLSAYAMHLPIGNTSNGERILKITLSGLMNMFSFSLSKHDTLVVVDNDIEIGPYIPTSPLFNLPNINKYLADILCGASINEYTHATIVQMCHLYLHGKVEITSTGQFAYLAVPRDGTARRYSELCECLIVAIDPILNQLALSNDDLDMKEQQVIQTLFNDDTYTSLSCNMIVTHLNEVYTSNAYNELPNYLHNVGIVQFLTHNQIKLVDKNVVFLKFLLGCFVVLNGPRLLWAKLRPNYPREFTFYYPINNYMNSLLKSDEVKEFYIPDPAVRSILADFLVAYFLKSSGSLN